MDYLLRTPLLLNSYLSCASGVVNRRRSVSKIDFLSILIPLPPLPEQQKIAKVLDTIQKAIEVQERIIDVTKNLKKSLMQKLFREGTKGEELKDTEIGLIPKSWKVVRLGEVANFKNGINFNKKQKGREGILTVDVLNMYNEGIYLNFKNLYRVNISLENNSDYLLKKGDILIVRSSLKREGVGWVSLFGGFEEIVTFCGFTIRIRLNDMTNILPEYLTYFLRSRIAREELISASGQVAITNITQGVLKSLKIPCPHLPEQQEIANILSTVHRKIEIEQRRKNVLRQLFKTMLHQLMSGKIRLKEVKI
jgi:type I restriction enzyme S subunit